MTKFILHGGETNISNQNNKDFYQEWLRDFDKQKIPDILLVYFARLESEWDWLEETDRERFARHTDNRVANFIVASADMTKFIQQLKDADVVYFRGGEPQKIVDALAAIKNDFLSLIKDKVCAGSSAGAMFLSDYAMSSSRGWQKYLGLLPINSIVHYSDSEHKQALEKFKADHPENENEFVLLPETEFIVKNY